MAKVERYRSVPHLSTTEEFGTLQQIKDWAIQENIPENAELRYEGCGSHSIEFVWEEEVPDPIPESNALLSFDRHESPFSELGPMGEDLSVEY